MVGYIHVQFIKTGTCREPGAVIPVTGALTAP